MAYSKTNWVNGQTPINETNLNKIETELKGLDDEKVNKSGDTMTGALTLKKTSFNYNNGTIPGTKLAAAHTIEDLINELRYTNGQIGSVEIKTAYTLNNVTIAVGWYNYAYIPHRTGGLDGGANSDSTNFGTLMLTGMTVSSPVYVLRYNNQNIAELKKLAQEVGDISLTTNLEDGRATAYRIGNIVIVTIYGTKTLSTAWTDYTIVTLSGVTAKDLYQAPIIDQSTGLCADIFISQNSNVIKINKRAVSSINQGYFRGQLVFVAN